MKKILSIAILMLATLLSFGQMALPQYLNTEKQELQERKAINQVPGSIPSPAMVAPFWSNDFSTLSDWVLDNSGQNPPDYGWSIDANVDGWYFNSAISSSSGGNFAELTNGDPTAGTGTQALNVTYTMTVANSIDILGLSGTDNVTLSYNEFGARFNDLQEVQVSTDGITYTTVADNLNYSVLSQSGGAAYTNPSPRSINLYPYIVGNASTVWIRFSWTTNFPNSATNPNVWVTYGWMIDDVELVETPANKLSLIEENFGGWMLSSPTITGDMGIPYTFNPISQAISNPYRCEGAIINSGSTVQSNTKLNVNIEDDVGTSVFSDNSTPIALNPFDTTIVATINTFTPTTVGPYHISFWASSDSTSTDTVTRSTIVTDTIYGRDYDWNSDGSNAGNGGYDLGASCGSQVLANAFEIYSVDTVTSISFFIDDRSVANAILKVELYEYDPTQGLNTVAPIWLGESDDYALQASDIDRWVTLKLNNPVIVFPGTGNSAYLAAVHGYAHPTDTSLISTSGNNGVVTFVQDNGCDIGNPSQPIGTWFSYSNTVMIRMNLGGISTPPSSINETTFSGNISIYPNPTTGIFTIEMNDVVKDIYTIKITNVLGQTIFTNSQLVNGIYKGNIDLSAFQKGVYLIEINNSTATITERIVVE